MGKSEGYVQRVSAPFPEYLHAAIPRSFASTRSLPASFISSTQPQRAPSSPAHSHSRASLLFSACCRYRYRLSPPCLRHSGQRMPRNRACATQEPQVKSPRLYRLMQSGVSSRIRSAGSFAQKGGQRGNEEEAENMKMGCCSRECIPVLHLLCVLNSPETCRDGFASIFIRFLCSPAHNPNCVRFKRARRNIQCLNYKNPVNCKLSAHSQLQILFLTASFVRRAGSCELPNITAVHFALHCRLDRDAGLHKCCPSWKERRGICQGPGARHPTAVLAASKDDVEL
ncbi:hypothetical protein B0H16DRAFT_516043 [Mycena metata]|uniref:Uncharacterized protein n=1 Tax=Mycena metata TaxID=1033252 RepID=A0AAD7NIT6_9AGAR|nr:hypothetical protein B0H16DRAFT_516043 [Mycena metata]